MLPVVCFVGRSGAGKTTLLVNIVPEIKARGYRVAVIKHAPHGFDMDIKGKDSWRFSHAGADIVAVSSNDKLCLIQQVVEDTPLEEILSMLEGKVDLVLVEGYKRSEWPTIEVMRSAVDTTLIHTPEDILAIVSDLRLPFHLPQFLFEDIKAIADFIADQLSKGSLTRKVGMMGTTSL